MADIAKLDLYGILEVAPDATDKEIVKAYRKKALKCHPDKNPDNPKAAEQFHELSKALEVLTDAAAKAAYDKVLQARKAAELRTRLLDSKRKKLKEDLEAREKAAEAKRDEEQELRKKFQSRTLEEEIERLRKEGSRLLQEEQKRLLEELKKKQDDSNDVSDEPVGARLKIKWKVKKGDETNGGYSYDILHKVLDKYGEITALVLSSKKSGSAIVEFVSQHAAVLAVQNEIGLPENPISFSWLSGQPVSAPTKPTAPEPKSMENFSSFSCRWDEPSLEEAPTSKNSGVSGFSFQPLNSQTAASQADDFESIVLRKMRQAEERKKLAEQISTEDGDS